MAADTAPTVDYVYAITEVDAGQKGLFGPRAVGTLGVGRLDIDQLMSQLRNFAIAIQERLGEVAKESVPYSLDEIAVTVEISAEGGIRLVTAASAGIKGGIMLTFKRRER